MARFAIRALIYTAVATALWWIAYTPLAHATIALAKFLQQMVGAPTPYLLIEVMDYWWLAPPVQLFVGLTLASYWISWPRRLGILIFGIMLLTFIVAMNILAASSPYLGPTTARYFVGLILTKSHLIVFPLIFWLILCALPTQHLTAANNPPPPTAPSVAKTPRSRRRNTSRYTFRQEPNNRPASTRWWPRALAAVALCLTLPLTLYILAAIAPAPVKQARADLMSALQAGDDRRSILCTARLGKAQVESHYDHEDQNLHYLLGRLCLRVGDNAAARTHLTNASIQSQAAARIQKEFLSSLPPATSQDATLHPPNTAITPQHSATPTTAPSQPN